MTKPTALLATVPSDSHSWNLIFMEFHMTDHGLDVTNLGPNTPAQEILKNLKHKHFDIVVISSVNGHGSIEGLELISSIKTEAKYSGEVYLGGKICTATKEDTVSEHIEELERAGFERVFDDSVTNSFDEFQKVMIDLTATDAPISLRATG